MKKKLVKKVKGFAAKTARKAQRFGETIPAIHDSGVGSAEGLGFWPVSAAAHIKAQMDSATFSSI